MEETIIKVLGMFAIVTGLSFIAGSVGIDPRLTLGVVVSTLLIRRGLVILFPHLDKRP